MAFKNSLITEQFENLVSNRQPPVVWHVTAKFVLADSEIVIHEVISRSITRDYANNRFDVHIAKLALPLTSYRKYIFPNKGDIKIRFKWELMDSKGIKEDSPENYSREYLALLTDPQDPTLARRDTRSEIASDEALGPMVEFNVQCIHRLEREMYDYQIGGITPNATISDLLIQRMSYNLNQDETKSGLSAKDYDEVRGVIITPCDNTVTYEHLIVKAHTKMIDLPFYLQHHYGVYSKGIGAYFQMNYNIEDHYQSAKGGWWWLYSLYDQTRFDSAERTLTVFLAPDNEAPNIEKTYSYIGKQLYVLSVGKKINIDYSEYEFFDKGNGLTYVRASELLDTTFTKKDDVVSSNVEETKRTFIVKSREDNVNNIQHVDGYYTDNPYKHTSTIARGLGRQMSITWTYADPDLLTPGMATKIQFMLNDKIESVYATLLEVSFNEAKATDKYMDNAYVKTAVLTFQLDK